MAEVLKELTLDVFAANRIKAIVAKQYDYHSRYLLIRLTDGGNNINVESSSVVTINAFRPDGDSAAFLGSVESDGRVLVPLAYWMLELEGTVKCDVSIVDTNERKLSSTNFQIEVEHANYSGDDIEPDEHYDLLVELLAEVAQAQEAENGRVAAESERVTAENGRVLAEIAREEAEEEREQALKDYAKIDGFYEGMTVGHAIEAEAIATEREIEDADEACPPITFGAVGGNAEVQDGYSAFKELRGNTIISGGTLLSSKSASMILRGRNQLTLNRTAGTLSGYENDNPRAFEEGKYYVGLTVNNYYSPSNVSNVVFGQESVSFQNAANGYGVAFPVRVIPGQTYLAETKNIAGNTVAISWYDKNGYIISFGGGSSYYHTATAPANAYWGVAILQPTVGSHTYSEIQFRLYYDTPNLPYVPYEEQVVTLPNIELRSAGSVYDVAYQEGGGKRRIGSVDLGTLNWVAGSGGNAHCFQATGFSGFKTFGSSDIANILCTIYVANTSNAVYAGTVDKSISISSVLRINDTAFDASTQEGLTAFKAAMSGVILYYELAEETDILLSENPGWEEFVKVDNFGTIEFTTGSAQTLQVPQAYFIRYTVNLVEFLDSAYVRCGGDADNIMLKSENVIPNAPTTNGNYVLKVSVVNGAATYSWEAEQ